MTSARVLGGVAVAIAVFGVCLELGLRALPGAIPLPLLLQFEPGLRASLASRQGLPTRDRARPLSRDDGGPELLVYAPGAVVLAYAPDPGMVGSVTLDSAGFCNPSAQPPKRADLVALGDSFTFCTTVEPADTWVARLGSELGVVSYDLGVPRLGVYEHLQLLERFGLPLAPRVVVMNVYAGNDLRDAVLYHEARARHETASIEASETSGTRLRNAFHGTWLGRRSLAANLAVAAASALAGGSEEPDGVERREGLRARDVDFRYEVELGGATIAFNPENGDRNEVVHADLLARGLVGVEVFDEALARFAALARERGFTPVLVLTPSAHVAYDRYVRFRDHKLATPLARFHRAQAEALARRADALGIPFLDATPALRAAAAELGARELLYFPRNLHFTPSGHRVLAAALRRFLEERGLSPPASTETGGAAADPAP